VKRLFIMLLIMLLVLCACQDTSGFDPPATWRAQLDLTRTAQAPVATPTKAASETPSATASPSPTVTQTAAITVTAIVEPVSTATIPAVDTPGAPTQTPEPPTATSWPTPTQIVQGTVTAGPPTSAADCEGYPCWHDVDRIYKVINPVWLCISAAPCGGVPSYQLRLRPVGELDQILCLYEIVKDQNVWASEFKCNAAFDRSWSAVIYNGKTFLSLVENRD
jgi:hypothetical protein